MIDLPEINHTITGIDSVKFPILKHTIFEGIREKYGQEFLTKYSEWSKEDSGERFISFRLHYFDVNGQYLKRYLLEQKKQMLEQL